VLSYVTPQQERHRFASAVSQLNAVWISNESPKVFPEIAKLAPRPPRRSHFLLAINGKPLAWTSPHGQSIHWFGR
jgi:hypothetical protein